MNNNTNNNKSPTQSLIEKVKLYFQSLREKVTSLRKKQSTNIELNDIQDELPSTVEDAIVDSSIQDELPSVVEDAIVESSIHQTILESEQESVVQIKRFKGLFKTKPKPILTQEQTRAKKLKLYKGLTTTFAFIVVLFTVGMFSFTSTSKKEFCISCHEMRPEYYTLHASPHADVECVSCHTNPGLDSMFKEKVRTFTMFFNKVSNRVEAPIVLNQPVTNKACNTCHFMEYREISPGDDTIIPHDKHEKAGISCVECHDGVVHAQIADRNLTKKSDLGEWSQVVGDYIMSEDTYRVIKMDRCVLCHESRGVKSTCGTCHSSTMFPDSHKQADFATTNVHGLLAREDITKCDYCHKYTTRKSIEVETKTDNVTSLQKKNEKTKVNLISAGDYALENDLCFNCHRKRPITHQDPKFFAKHGELANERQSSCFGCHSQGNKARKSGATNATACSRCHPAVHARNYQYKKHHPVPIKSKDAIEKSCYDCHSEERCIFCHINKK